MMVMYHLLLRYLLKRKPLKMQKFSSKTIKPRNPVAKEIRNPKFRLRVILDKTKKLFRKRKHKGTE